MESNIVRAKRGRPRKIKTENTAPSKTEKRGIGRPRKVVIVNPEDVSDKPKR